MGESGEEHEVGAVGRGRVGRLQVLVLLVTGLLAVGLLVVSGGRSALAAGAGDRPATAPRESTGPAPTVSVVGNRLVTGDGSPIRLLGVARSGTEYRCAHNEGIFDGPSDDASIAAMASWHINAVRLPLNEDCWLGINGAPAAYSGAIYRAAIVDYVQRLHAHGLLVALDLHTVAPGNQLATGLFRLMADADHSPALWRSVAATFRDDHSVVFDLFNEPHDISWACLRDGCVAPKVNDEGGWQVAGYQSLVDAVRSTGATQPVLVGGLGYSSDVSQWRQWRPSDPAGQVVAKVHSYDFGGCAQQGCWDATVAPLTAGVPVVFAEVGEVDCRSDFTVGLMRWADGHGVGYLAFSWNTYDCSGPGLIRGYDGTPTVYGTGVRQHFGLVAGLPQRPTRSPFDTPRLGRHQVVTPTWTPGTRPTRRLRPAFPNA